MADTIEGFFASLEQRIDPAKTAGMNATFQFDITDEGGGQWYVTLSDGAPKVASGAADSPNITLTASAADWQSIVSGELSGQSAFLTGKLRIQGDMALAMKLQSIL